MTEVVSVAAVTGGAHGLGLEIVRYLAGEGMAVLAVDRNPQFCAEARTSLAAFADRVRVMETDIGTLKGAGLAVDTAIKSFGQLDLLCNNAAVHPLSTIEAHSLDSWRETFRVNVDGPMLCSQAAVPHMRGRGTGSIVNIGSVSGLAPYATGGAYAASKAALIMLSKTLALEVAQSGITVNCICPGSIKLTAEKPLANSTIPVGRTGLPEDVASLVAYLGSKAARYMTGAVLVLDGGATAGRTR